VLPDDDAFDAFYRAEFGRLAGALHLLCGDRRRAEEHAQEAFVRAYGAWPRVAAMERPAGWLYVTAFNLVKRQRRRVDRELPTEGALGIEDRLAVREAIAALPLKQRKAVVARHVLGFTTNEAANLLGVTPEALRSLLHRAVVALRLDLTHAVED
jgi:RNA polymerase sigma-70 factor (ECF subfamily)